MSMFLARPLRHLKSRFSVLSLMFVLAASCCFGQTLTTIYNFGAFANDGVAPGSGVILDKTGNVYGTTGVGGFQGSDGTVFRLTPPSSGDGTWTETILHAFKGSPDGKISESRLAMSAQGVLFGTTLRGGSVDSGTVYALFPTAGQGQWREQIVHSFGTVTDDVASPNLGVTITPQGLYGVDQTGANNTGAFYLLTRIPGSTAYQQNILYSFGAIGSGDAFGPSGELVRDAKGNFYGVTAQGGANDLGAVYKLSPPASQGGTWTESVIFSFNGTDGTLASGRLLLGKGGVLYGTTEGGGDNSAGTVFQLTPPVSGSGAWTQTVLYSFTGGNDGGFPENGVIMDGKGNLLGTASLAVFQLTPPASGSGSWAETALHNFTGPDGFIANNLTLFQGAVYGTTQEGGAFGVGTAYKLTLP
jgi:uncharacterized repeat protein (TIGR03803 family)